MNTSSAILTASADDLYEIAPLDVMYLDGPVTGTRDQITWVHTIDGLDAVWSKHGRGFYWLTWNSDPHTGIHYAVWEPHPDARFDWVRFM
jgi:hypothetical protein